MKQIQVLQSLFERKKSVETDCVLLNVLGGNTVISKGNNSIIPDREQHAPHPQTPRHSKRSEGACLWESVHVCQGNIVPLSLWSQLNQSPEYGPNPKVLFKILKVY